MSDGELLLLLRLLLLKRFGAMLSAEPRNRAYCIY